MVLGSIGASCREKGSLPATLPQCVMRAELFWLGDPELGLPHQPSAVVVAQPCSVTLPHSPTAALAGAGTRVPVGWYGKQSTSGSMAVILLAGCCTHGTP